MKILLATNNYNKVKEYQMMAKGYDITFLTLKDVGINIDVEETGKTFKENSLLKASEIAKLTNEIVIADDSGLNIDSLPDILGIYSKRFMEDKPYSEKCKTIIKKLKGKNRSAHFTCAITICNLDNNPIQVEGILYGKISHFAYGKNGFGYDPIFIPKGKLFTTAFHREMFKINCCHRAIAFKQALKIFKDRGLI